MSAPRPRLTIARDLLDLTRRMKDNCSNADFLLESVPKRQTLMDEFDAVPDTVAFPKPERTQIHELFTQAAQMDKTITAALEKHKTDVKDHLSSSNSQQKVLSYTKNTMSSSGSYLDIKK